MTALPEPGRPAPPPAPPARAWRAYGTAALLVALALVVRVVLGGVLGTVFPYLTVYPVVILLLWRRQPGPALAAALLAVLVVETAAPLLGVPREAWQANAPLRLATVAICVGVLFAIGAALGRLQDQSQRLAQQHEVLAGEAAAAAARFDAIVQHASDAIMSSDRGGIIRSWNPAAERLFGYAPDDIIGRPVSLLAPPGRQNEPLLSLERVLQGEVVVGDAVRRTRDGRELTVRVALAPMQAADGTVYGATAIVHDVSERARAEEALRQADRRKDVFLATLAHELRNPLAALVSQVDLLRLTGSDAGARARSVAVMQRQTRQLTRLVNDLLDISRITQGHLSLQLQPLSVNHLLQAAAEAAADNVAAARQRLQVQPLAADATVFGDEARLLQVLSNLLHNAVKFSPPDSHTVLRARAEAGWVHVEVEDQGMGIAPGLVDTIFDMFSQASTAVGRPHDGLGIGLALSRRLAELHGGRLRAASAGPGQGSCFTLSLAMRTPAQQAAERLATAAPGVASVSVRGPAGAGHGAEPEAATPALRILVVDDNQDAAAALTDLLRLAGHEVAMALDGHTAIRACSSRAPDAMVVDIGMPGLDGYQTAQAIRALPAEHPPLLIALSGWGQPADRERSLQAGFDLHLVKPVDVDELRRALARATRTA
jgi:PAS domain S-box-containing protein